MPLRLVGKLPRTVATRLYLACSIAGLAALSIAIASLHFTTRARLAVEDFHTEALPGLMAASDLAVLLERHRRIVEAAPLVVDRQEIDSDRHLSEAIAERIGELVERGANASSVVIRNELPMLVERARKVLFLAANYAQQGAMDEVEHYVRSAARIEDAIKAYRRSSLQLAERDVALVSAGGRWLTTWVIVAMLAMALVAVPTAWLLTGTVKRLRMITRAMFRLARKDTQPAELPTGDDDEVGEMARAVAVFRANAVQLMEQRSTLEELHRRLDIALGNMSHGLSMFDSEQRLVVSNGRYAEIYSLPPELTVPGTRFASILTCYRANGEAGDVETVEAETDAWRAELVARMGRSGYTETRSLHDGRIIEVTYRPIEGGGWVDVHEDISEKRAAEERIARLAREDTLTGVANRHAFREALDRCLTGGAERTGFAIHWIDLDRFKEINDVHGHPAGDMLLAAVAKRLREAVRATDFVARLGGDEFAVVQRDAPTWAEAGPLARRLIEVLSAPYMVSGHLLSIGASIGVALSSDVSGSGPEALLHNADLALYEAKAGGRGQAVLFREEIERGLRDRRALEADLRHALDRNEFELHYQPIVDAKTEEVRSCEALVRWRHPRRGLVSPGVFIPLAEELGLISSIGAWVLATACEEASRWPAGIGVAVNLSAAQFESDDILALTERVLAETGLAPERLEIEVTETLMLADRTETRDALHRLGDMGVSIALDDFGTGYASLSYLRSFPFDKIKIDQTFVRELPNRSDCFAIVAAICEMARTLEIRTVAEGIETEEHKEWVRKAGCTELQGYLFGRPVPASELAVVFEFLTQKKTLAA